MREICRAENCRHESRAWSDHLDALVLGLREGRGLVEVFTQREPSSTQHGEDQGGFIVESVQFVTFGDYN